MAIIDDKRKIFGQIAALRTLCEDFPDLRLNASFPSINTNKNSLNFLTDLLKALVGFEALRGLFVNTIVFQLDRVEVEVKRALKKSLKDMVSCGVDPSIPDFVKHQAISTTATGIDIELKDLDYAGIMFVEPTSELGALLYDDASAGLSSTDYNTFLFGSVQTDTVQQDWGAVTSANDILSVEFNSVGTPNNTVNIRTSQYYSTPSNNKTLTDLNNDYIDSIELFGSDKMINNIIDTIFGSVSFEVKKTRKQLESEQKVMDVVERFFDLEDEDAIDDSFFTFSNDETRGQEEIALNRSRGITKLVNCDNVESAVAIDTVIDLNGILTGTTTDAQKAAAITSAIDTLGDESAGNVPDGDKYTAKLSFIDNLIQKIMIATANVILSPKVMTIFMFNAKIVYGPNIDIGDALKFMELNKTFMRELFKAIRDVILTLVLKEVLRQVAVLVSCNAVGSQVEKAKNQKNQLLSLVGVPQSVIRQINNLA